MGLIESMSGCFSPPTPYNEKEIFSGTFSPVNVIYPKIFIYLASTRIGSLFVSLDPAVVKLHRYMRLYRITLHKGINLQDYKLRDVIFSAPSSYFSLCIKRGMSPSWSCNLIHGQRYWWATSSLSWDQLETDCSLACGQRSCKLSSIEWSFSSTALNSHCPSWLTVRKSLCIYTRAHQWDRWIARWSDSSSDCWFSSSFVNSQLKASCGRL